MAWLETDVCWSCTAKKKVKTAIGYKIVLSGKENHSLCIDSLIFGSDYSYSSCAKNSLVSNYPVNALQFRGRTGDVIYIKSSNSSLVHYYTPILVIIYCMNSHIEIIQERDGIK